MKKMERSAERRMRRMPRHSVAWWMAKEAEFAEPSGLGKASCINQTDLSILQ